jgi:dihydrofolate reductase
MRKLKLQVQISVDGFISGPNGEMDWLNFNWDENMKSYIADVTDPVDTIILGKNLAMGFIPHWASKPADEPAWFIDKMNSSKKVVFSKTLKQSEWEGTELATGDLVEEVTSLKKQPGGDIIVYGGGAFVSSLIKAGLIDEFHLFINPVALGNGMPIFKNLQQKQQLTLKQCIGFECGIVLMNYALSK